MSTFPGKIKEYPGVSVDRFDGDNENSDVYFLSHCHSDHMVGLNNIEFQENLVENHKFLYSSAISCTILSKLYPYISDNVIELNLHVPKHITLRNSDVSVTAIPAEHCPGSVMYLFEGKVRVLYTGDFRVYKGDIRKFKTFYDSHGNVKIVDKIYLDTTFFFSCYYRFPTREDSVNELYKIIKDWVNRGSNFYIRINTSAKYGYETLFMEIYKKLGIPVHVNQEMYDFYRFIPEMDKSVTLNGAVTQIHCACGSTYKSVCNSTLAKFIKTIKISAFRWNQYELARGISYCDSDIHYLCYSTHASKEECLDLLRFLEPKEIEACVKPSDPEACAGLLESLDKVLRKLRQKEDVIEEMSSGFYEIEEHLGENNLVTEDNDTTTESPPKVLEDTDKDFIDFLGLTPSTSMKDNAVNTKKSYLNCKESKGNHCSNAVNSNNVSEPTYTEKIDSLQQTNKLDVNVEPNILLNIMELGNIQEHVGGTTVRPVEETECTVLYDLLELPPPNKKKK